MEVLGTAPRLPLALTRTRGLHSEIGTGEGAWTRMATSMKQGLTADRPNVATAVRTLLLSGYTIENNHRQPTHTELTCSAPLLGIEVPLLLALTEADDFPPSIRERLTEVAKREGRGLVVVAALPGRDQLGWLDFLDYFGGPVPSWRALSDDYLTELETASMNSKPEGFEGEVWRLYEQLVADGLEFCFGRKVRRLGAAKRGQRVSDLLTQIPEGEVLVVDAKATATTFDAAFHELRPLIEYTKNQKIRQKGSFEVFAALVVSKAYTQDAGSLAAVSREFLSEVGSPVAFLHAADLAYFVTKLRDNPHVRPGMRWKRIFAGGLVVRSAFDNELSKVNLERC